MTDTVLIASPVRQKPEILECFLASLERLHQSSCIVRYCFIDDNQEKASKQLLKQFQERHARCVIEQAPPCDTLYTCDTETHRWKEELVWKVASFKDHFLQVAREGGDDWLFLVDSDLVLHPKTLQHLIGLRKQIISNIFWTQWREEWPPLPQVWMTDRYNQFTMEIGERLSEEGKLARREEFLAKMRIPGTYEVGGLGACTLIHRSAFLLPLHFQKIDNLLFWGEDRHFCVRARALGVQLFVDTHYPAYHIYRDTDLLGVEDFVRASQP